MLPLMLRVLVLCLLAVNAQAQAGVVTSLQRPGAVPQAVLDKLVALEAKHTAVNGDYTTYAAVINSPGGCSSSTVYAGSCGTMPGSSVKLTQISATTTTNNGDMAGTGGMVTRMHTFFNTGSSGCPTASGWSFCTRDQIQQASTLRISGYNSGTSFTGRYFTMDPNYVAWASGGVSGATTTSCFLMDSALSTTYIVPSAGFNSMARHFNLYSFCDTAANYLCCKLN